MLVQNDEDVLTNRRLTSETSGVEDDTTEGTPTLLHRFAIEEKLLKGFLEVIPTNVEQRRLAVVNDHLIDRNVSKLSLKSGLTPYYLVFAPLNKQYNASFSKDKGLMTIGLWLRKFFGIQQYFGTTEVFAQKVHHNFIIWYDGDFRSVYDAYGAQHMEVKVVKNKWTMHIEPVGRLLGLIEYITKEKYYRVFAQSKDITVFNGIPEVNRVRVEKKKKLAF